MAKILLGSQTVDLALTAAWREPHRDSGMSHLSSMYRRFHVAQDAPWTKHGPVHVCAISWRLSNIEILEELILKFLSIFVGCVSGVLSSDYGKGLDTIQALIDVPAGLLSLDLLFMKYQLWPSENMDD